MKETSKVGNAIDRLAKHIENGELLVETDPVAFLDTVTERFEHIEAQLQVFVEWTCEVSAHGMVPGQWILDKLRELGLTMNVGRPVEKK
jgi:hypothetical protein